MSVLTLAGKPINWAKPPKPTDMVMWSQRTTSGKVVRGSLYAIAHLDRLNNLAIIRFGVPIVILQGPFNTTVAASAGTHDYDMCFDGWIPGVPGPVQQRFFRANGGGAYLRVPPAFVLHIHWLTLPPREGASVSDDYAVAGYKVGKYVDGGYSTYGRLVTSSQIDDYYHRRTALAGHAHDPSWFPPNIDSTLFDLDAYIERQRARMKPEAKTLTVQTCNVEAMVTPPLGKSLALSPQVVALQQAGRAGKHLRTFKQYRTLGYRVGEEARGIKTLVRKGSRVKRKRRIDMSMSWIGPKTQRRHDPRTYMAVRLLVPFRCWVVNVHFPTGGPNGPNAKAWHESWRRLLKFIAKKKRVVVVGDFNATVEQMRVLLRDTDLALRSVGKVDHSLAKGLKHVSTKRDIPGTPAGVHGWGSFTYKKKD